MDSEWVVGCMDGWMDGQYRNEWMDSGCRKWIVDGLMDEWMDGQQID